MHRPFQGAVLLCGHMPPAPQPHHPETNPELMLPEHQKSGAGPIVGIIIIVILVIFGALYFWGAALNARSTQQPLPLIPGDVSNS